MLSGLLAAISLAAAIQTEVQQSKPPVQQNPDAVKDDFGLLIVKMSKQELGQVLKTLQSNQPEGGEPSGESSQMEHSGLHRRYFYNGWGNGWGNGWRNGWGRWGGWGSPYYGGFYGGSLNVGPSGYVATGPLGGSVTAGPSGYIATGAGGGAVVSGPSGTIVA